MLLIYLWGDKTKGKGYDIQMLLPNKKEFSVLLALLIIAYIVMGILIRPEALPGLFPQLIIWLIYAGLFILLFLHLRKSKKMTLPKTTIPPINFSWEIVIILSLLFTISSVISNLMLGDFRDTIILTFWFVEGVIGVSIPFLSTKDLILSIWNLEQTNASGLE